MEWNDCKINPAPKDGFPFLGFGFDTLKEEFEIVTMCYWPGGWTEDEYNVSEGFFALGQWGKINQQHSCDPSHWMPLPKYPEEILEILAKVDS